MSYWRFGAMILTSTVTMFVLMYLNTYALEHLFWSETRAYMALLMGATMAVIMLAFMLSMYSSTPLNAAIFVGALLLFAGSLWLVRSQETVQDRSFMGAMIPHHSIAIMTASRAELSDARVEKLAEEIVAAQNREIAEMRYLIADIGTRGETETIYQDPPARAGTLEDALDRTLTAGLDPAPVARDDLPEDALPEDALPGDAPPGNAGGEALSCGFRRVADEDPILLTGADAAVMKLNGIFLTLEGRGDGVYATPGLTMTLRELPEANWRGGAELIFALERGPTVGYRGFYDCDL